ncbi:hypothetical protein C1646_666969 [Rhizophagus diaphanus]|nr:hypothetical protein C1646_666969 [Rhizophagus diaphanus] [Rhizophagus sp. MUCL 43196]
MSFEYFQEVANDYEKLLYESDEKYDVIIYSGENNNAKEIYAHSFILCARSKYFRTGLPTVKCNDKYIFNKPNITPQIFEIILRFIYCGKINLTNLQAIEVLKLLIAADELNIQTLIMCIQKYLIEHHHEFLQQNSIEILGMIYQHESFIELWNFYLDRICEDPLLLFNSNKFINLNANFLELLLKRDDLNSDEIIIWDSLIKWCLAQHSNISQNVRNWNNEDFKVMEKVINRFIPLIRFHDISPEDFISKVFPYKNLMQDDLITRIFTFHMVPSSFINLQRPRKSKYVFNSTLIESKHFSLFSSWIEKKNNVHYSPTNNPYSYNLIYRASRDGNTPVAFHSKCDNKGATIVVIKINNSNQIVGGYNPLQWDSSNKYKPTSDSFIFSFKNSVEVGYSNNNQFSIGCCSAYGPMFGGGFDLYFNNDGWRSNTSDYSSYPKIDVPGYFRADDYEVFQVIRKCF